MSAKVVVFNPSIPDRLLLRRYKDVYWTDRFGGRSVEIYAGSFSIKKIQGPPTPRLLNALLAEARLWRYEPPLTPPIIQPIQKPEPVMLDTRYQQPVVSVLSYKAELEKLIGLAGPKAEIERLASFAEMVELRRLSGLPRLSNSFNMVFTGNPGVGKTTAARITAKVLKDHRLLARGHLVEVDRSTLVGPYIGHSEQQTKAKLQEAVGGVLFVDEFPSLVVGGNDFGGPVVDTIVKFMEDHREELCVIVAGYTEPMKKAIASNPGLKSRFTRTIHFPDYSAEELAEIFDEMRKAAGYELDRDAFSQAWVAIKAHHANRGPDFGNARDMRTFFERLTEVQADRVIRANSSLTQITSADILQAASLLNR